MTKMTKITKYDSKHFCQSWCACCEANLKLKPKQKYDPKHFCPSWCKCCDDNLALKGK